MKKRPCMTLKSLSKNSMITAVFLAQISDIRYDKRPLPMLF